MLETGKAIIANNFKVLIGNLNNNSLSNKFDQLRKSALKLYVQVLVITETKIENTFITSQILVTGFYVS